MSKKNRKLSKAGYAGQGLPAAYLKPVQSWDTGEVFSYNVAEACSCKGLPKPVISICQDVSGVFEHLRKTIKVEWQVFLGGIIDENHNITINSYIIPKQNVTSSTVECIECVDQQFVDEHSIVASIHSHGDMGVFFSGVDDKANCSLIKAHMVTNNDRDFVGVYRHVLPCGMDKFLTLNLATDVPMTQIVEGKNNINHVTEVWGFGNKTTEYPYDPDSDFYGMPVADVDNYNHTQERGRI